MIARLGGACALTVLAAACTMSQAPDARLYAALDDADTRSAATTMQRTLETAADGEARSWRNPKRKRRAVPTLTGFGLAGRLSSR